MNKQDVNQIRLSAVFYTDGSAVPNPGNGGWGIYGYTYDEDKEVKLSANQTKNIMTNRGFLNIHEVKEDDEIKPCRKIDELFAFGTAHKPLVANNEMELKALEKAFSYAMDKGYQDVTVISDSKGSLDSITHWYDKWEKNGWVNSKGTEVKMKDQIQVVYKLKEDLAKQCRLSLRWVKGHSGNKGNDQVDKLANYGTTLHRHGKQYEEFSLKTKEDKLEMQTSDMFTKNRWYFIGGKDIVPTSKYNDYYVYYTGAYGNMKKDADFGMHTADGFMSIILAKEPEPVIEKIQQVYSELCKHDYNYVVCGNLDTALTPASYEDIMAGSIELICDDPAEKTLSLPSGKVICTEYNPPHLSYTQMEKYDRLTSILTDYVEQKEIGSTYIHTDITNDLIEEKEVGKKKQKQLKKSIQSANFIKLPVKYSTDQGKTIKEADIKLTIKTDLPDKMHLNKLIKNHEDLKITVVTKRSSDTAFKYYLVVEMGGNYGLWVNLDTALIKLKP